MPQITGKATIRVDGQVLRTLDDATINPGGQNRTAKKGGGKIHGYSEEDVEPSMECKIAHTKDLSLKWLSGLTNATIDFETDTGMQFLLRQAWTSEPAVLNAKEGEVDLKMGAMECDEIT